MSIKVMTQAFAFSDFERQHNLNIEAAIAAEKKAVASIKRMARNNSMALQALWRRGNGAGGGVLDIIAEELGVRLPSEPRPAACKIVNRKKVIPSGLRTQVFERDEYRCKHCGTHKSLTADHIHPESIGGATTFENLQTLCRPCNSKKGASL